MMLSQIQQQQQLVAIVKKSSSQKSLLKHKQQASIKKTLPDTKASNQKRHGDDYNIQNTHTHTHTMIQNLCLRINLLLLAIFHFLSGGSSKQRNFYSLSASFY